MSDIVEQAHEAIEHHGSPHTDPFARRVAVLVSALAATLALAEIGAKSSQTEYLTHHVAVSNDYAYYQAKNQRAVLKESEIGILSSLPNAQDEAVQARIKAANEYIARMHDDPKAGNGMKQLLETTKEQEQARDEAFHRYHIYEFSSGAIEISIVLASVAVVTRIRNLAWGAAAIGAAAGLGTLGVALGVL